MMMVNGCHCYMRSTNLYKLKEDNEVRVDLQFTPILCHHIHYPLHYLCVTTGVHREARGWRQVGVLLQCHCFVQVILYNMGSHDTVHMSHDSNSLD